jgi:signal transduction histidine kinase
MNQGPTTLPNPAERPFQAWREQFWRRVLAAPSVQRQRRLYMALTFALVSVIGAADYLTGSELSLLVFYLIPVCTAVAAAGRSFGTATAVLSVVIWLIGDFAAGARFANPFVPVWNALIALVTYLVVVWLLSSLLGLQRELEARVRQRTAALTDEIAERVRLEKAVLEITERERRAIGHDLHDGLSQHLTGTALVAQALVGRLASRSQADAAEMQKIVALVETGIEQTRSLANGLLLAEIDRDGLEAALNELAGSLRAQFRLEGVFTCAAPVNLDENGTATHLYRIAVEAARNAVRHGRCRRVGLDLRADNGNLVLTVTDDGSGLPPPGQRGDGLGLRIMAHRAAMIGAIFSVEAQPSGGTVVACRLPHRIPRP